MNRYLHIIFTLSVSTVVSISSVFAQVSPYSLSPDWSFGQGGRLTFPTGSYPTSAAPTTGSRVTNAGVGVENSTSICFTDGSVALYTNTMQVYNGASIAGWWDYIRDLSGEAACAGSSTGGAVAFPDPASPTNAFYLIIANDVTSGGCANQGVHQYRFTGTGTTVAYSSRTLAIVPNAFAGEALTVGTDGTGGYWVVVHNSGTANTFRVRHYTSGAITTLADQTVGAAVSNVSASQSYLKISPCQDKIAYHSGGTLVVHNWDRLTGTVGAELRRITPVNFGVGLEFSPDGSRVYYSGQGNAINYVDIASGTITPVAGSASWSMQLGPDAKIYTSPGGSTSTLGIISNPNGAASYGTTSLPGGATIFRGLSNMAWLTPQVPVITPAATATCNIYDFSFVFKNYFNSNIPVNLASVTWNWGDASANTTGNLTPQHTFPTTGGPYTVTLTFTDQSCSHSWTTNIPVTITCSAPVELLNFAGLYNHGNVDLTWQTATEVNNDYFELQRSVDGINFTTIASIEGAGNSSSILDYEHTDVGVSGTILYYRLLQHDFDGTIKASKIISVRLDKIGSAPIVIMPNPFSSSFTLTKVYAEVATVSVYDVLGRLLEQKITSEGELSITLGEALSNGSYIVQYATTTNSYTLHVEKK